MQAMTRIVGFPFGGVAGGVARDPVSADGTPALAVFNRTHGSFSDATAPDQTVPVFLILCQHSLSSINSRMN